MVVAAAGVFLMVASPATAQIANQSDITGISVTSSSIVSPVFGVAPGGTVRLVTFITPQIADSYQQAAARINAELASQSFTTDNGYQPPAQTQNLLYEVASGAADSGSATSRLLTRLTTGNANPSTVSDAEAFVESFRGLLARGIAMNPEFYNSLTATQLANAVAAYNAFVNSSNEAFLSAPPPELAAIQGILTQLTAH